jgi:hypothetical protein
LANGHLGEDELNVVQTLGEALVVVGLNVQARLQGGLQARLSELVNLLNKVADKPKYLKKLHNDVTKLINPITPENRMTYLGPASAVR